MGKTSKKSNKFVSRLLMSIAYFFFAMVLVINSAIILHRKYYLSIYVDGESMKPTLNGDYYPTHDERDGKYTIKHDVNFGVAETSEKVKRRLNRFNVVVCYYPWDKSDYAETNKRGQKPLDTATNKIKRVIALPGETLKIVDNVIFIKNPETEEWEEQELTFERNLGTKIKNVAERTLGDDEYWVMGDNWSNSNDSASEITPGAGPIYYENINGVLISILGTCNVRVNNYDPKDEKFVGFNYWSKPLYFF